VATITFQAGENFTINTLGDGQGIGFYGAGGFGTSVRVGEYAETAYITNSTGTVEGARIDCAVYTGISSAKIGTVNYDALTKIPNYLATLRIQFEHDTPVRVQNAQLRAFNRVDIDVPPVGVTTKAAEIIHPGTTADDTGTGDTTWSSIGGAGGVISGTTFDPPLSLAPSPGVNGESPDGSMTQSTQHHWFVLISQSPDVLGARTANGLWFSCEYL